MSTTAGGARSSGRGGGPAPPASIAIPITPDSVHAPASATSMRGTSAYTAALPAAGSWLSASVIVSWSSGTEERARRASDAFGGARAILTG